MRREKTPVGRWYVASMVRHLLDGRTNTIEVKRAWASSCTAFWNDIQDAAIDLVDPGDNHNPIQTPYRHGVLTIKRTGERLLTDELTVTVYPSDCVDDYLEHETDHAEIARRELPIQIDPKHYHVGRGQIYPPRGKPELVIIQEEVIGQWQNNFDEMRKAMETIREHGLKRLDKEFIEANLQPAAGLMSINEKTGRVEVNGRVVGDLLGPVRFDLAVGVDYSVIEARMLGHDTFVNLGNGKLECSGEITIDFAKDPRCTKPFVRKP